PQFFANQLQLLKHLVGRKIDIFDKPLIRMLGEAGIWGSIRHHGLLGSAVIVSDDAAQFRVGNHALFWVHAERLLLKLVPATPEQVRLALTTPNSGTSNITCMPGSPEPAPAACVAASQAAQDSEHEDRAVLLRPTPRC